MDGSWFSRLQIQHFARADGAKFRWQTADPYQAATERALLGLVKIGGAERLLEVGCGEGGNLKLMAASPRQAIGVDYSLAKVQWAARHVPGARFVRADATQLPFDDGSFDVVLCRDLLHHLAVPDKKKVLAESVRVCRDAGRIVVIEPNGCSPIVRLQGLIVEAERDLLLNSWRRLEPFFDRRQVAEPEVVWAQPFPVGRVLFHYRWGLSRLSRFLARSVLGLERLIGKFVPSQRSAYIVITTSKRQAACR